MKMITAFLRYIYIYIYIYEKTEMKKTPDSQMMIFFTDSLKYFVFQAFIRACKLFYETKKMKVLKILFSLVALSFKL